MAIDVNIPSQVKNYANLAAFPATGTLKTIFIAEDTNKTYRWTGSAYVEISATAASTWGAIGGTLSNQTDLQNALNTKEPTITAGTTSQYYRGDKSFQTLDKNAVGLSNVDNTSDVNKPVSTATQTALNAKQDTLVSATNIKTINGNTLLGSGDLVVGGSSAIAIGTTAITSGTVGRVLFEGTGNVVQESANLFWNNTNGRLGIGTSTPAGNIDINANFATTGYPLIVKNTGYFNAFFQGTSANNQASFYLENDRGSTHSYGGFAIGGSTSTLGNIFGLTRPDRLFMFADGAYNVGYAIGTLQNVPLQFGTNNAIRATVFGNGNIGINTTTDAGYRLDVNGTARVQGNTTISLNQNGVTLINASNTTSGTASTAELRATTGGGFIGLGKYSASTNSYKFIASSDSYLYSATIGDIAIINDFASGRIKFGAGASSTAQATLFSTGNFAINTTTDAGFKLDVNGTARVSGILTAGSTINQGFTSSATNVLLSTHTSSAVTNTGIYAGGGASFSVAVIGNRMANAVLDWQMWGGIIVQAIGVNGSLNSSAILQADSTTKGFLPPRMTTTQKNAIATPATGLMVYDTTLNVITYYNGTTWI